MMSVTMNRSSEEETLSEVQTRFLLGARWEGLEGARSQISNFDRVWVPTRSGAQRGPNMRLFCLSLFI